MGEGKPNYDHILLRLKDAILIGGAIFTFFAWGLNFVALPKRVEANEGTLKTLQVKDIEQDLKIQSLDQQLAYISKNTDEIKVSMKSLWQRTSRETRVNE